ncbi:hypothetical protein CU097_006220, partial [Rhizopus azygosporus]
MPPYSYPITFEEIEAKEWASNTVKGILTDISPVSFESGFTSLEVIHEDNIQGQEKENHKKSLKRMSTLRRSFSFLESSLFRNNNNSEQ